MLALRGDAESHGVMFAFETPVLAGCARERGLIIETGGPASMRIAVGMVVNAAGLDAQAIALDCCMPRDAIPSSRQRKLLFLERTLSFLAPHCSMPTPGALGVHLTLDLAGQAKFGPDVEWVDAIGYNVDPRRVGSF